MNTEPPLESTTKRLLAETDCYGTDSQVAALNVITDQRRGYQLAYAHFLYSELAANPALEEKPDAPPQQLMIYFSMAVVTVLGAALRQIDKAVQKNDLKYVQRGTLAGGKLEQYASPNSPVVASVIITFTKDNS
jgi:hypothetical protein